MTDSVDYQLITDLPQDAHFAQSVSFNRGTRIEPAEYSAFLLEMETALINELSPLLMQSGSEIRIANMVQTAVEETLPIAAFAYSSAPPPPSASADLFAEMINYHIAVPQLDNTPAQLNGNITSIAWQVGCRNPQNYAFKYDLLDRLKQATYAETEPVFGNYVNMNNYNETSLAYDKRGNITRTIRRGAFAANNNFGNVDNLTFSYPTSSNRLGSVTELTGSQYVANGLKTVQTATGIGNYNYDVNGNVVSDEHKNISSVAYNHLNLPKLITFGTGDWIKINYDASGKKLRKETGTPDKGQLIIVPNPNNGVFTLKVEAVLTDAEVRITRTNGMLVHQATFGDGSFDLSAFPPEAYISVVIWGEKSEMATLIKN